MTTIKQELFRFVSTRKVERFEGYKYQDRLIKDGRSHGKESVYQQLFSASSFENKLEIANTLHTHPRFVHQTDKAIYFFDAASDYFRSSLKKDADLDSVLDGLFDVYPESEDLIRDKNSALYNGKFEIEGNLWDSLYIQLFRGCYEFTSTNYLADAIRCIHICRTLGEMRFNQIEQWHGSDFDEYELLIGPPDFTNQSVEGLRKANPEHTRDQDKETPPLELKQPGHDIESMETELELLKEGYDRFVTVMEGGDIETKTKNSKPVAVLNAKAIKELKQHPAFKDLSLKDLSTDEISDQLIELRKQASGRLSNAKMEMNRAQLRNRRIKLQQHSAASPALTEDIATKTSALSSSTLQNMGGHFYVPLETGEIRPPVVGDLVLVEQELKKYEMGELADIQNILKGEQREKSYRDTSRTSSTNTYESESETTETESITTDERFQLSQQAEKNAANSFSANLGVNVSAKYGPVEIGVSANASYSQSRSSSESRSQEFARQVTEEASKTVRNRILESSSTTIMSESEETALHAFNNVDGPGHISGLYRWVDKLYEARSVNYGRRLMLNFDVPEPAAFFRGIMDRDEEMILETIEKPFPLTEAIYNASSQRISHAPEHVHRMKSYHQITEENYAYLAAHYGVTDINPPPPNKVTHAQAFSYPTASEASKLAEHTQTSKELTYVTADNSIKVDPDYMIENIGVWATTTGSSNGHDWYADTLKLGMNANDENTLLVLVGNKSFYFNANASNSQRVTTNFNQTQPVTENQIFGGVIQSSLPVTVQADFEGVYTFIVQYTAFLRPDGFKKWQIDTCAKLEQGYQKQLRDYEQKSAVAKNKIEKDIEQKTYQLRDAQYRQIERTELKRNCIELLSHGTAHGYHSVHTPYDSDFIPEIAFERPAPHILDWRAPLANGTVARFFEESFDWDQMTYVFHPYYWTSKRRWRDLLELSGNDPVFEEFLKSGLASVNVPAKPGAERSIMFFLKTGLIWGGGYLPLLEDPDMMQVYSDVENGIKIDPPKQIGDTWQIKMPTSMVKLQETSELPEFDVSFDESS